MSQKKVNSHVDKEFEEFYKTPVGAFIAALGNYNYLIEQMLLEHPEEETLKTENETSTESLRFFVEKFENFQRIDDYYIDDTKLLLAMLDEIDSEKRERIFKIVGTYIQMIEKSEGENSSSEIFTELLPVVKAYNETASVYSKIELGEGQYALLLRQIFRFSIKNAESFIEQPKNETELNFGYEFRNYSLICRSKMKTVTTDSDSIQFVFDFYETLTEQEKQYFMDGILASFIECCQSDLDKERSTFDNELEYSSVERQIQWEIKKKYKLNQKKDQENKK